MIVIQSDAFPFRPKHRHRHRPFVDFVLLSVFLFYNSSLDDYSCLNFSPLFIKFLTPFNEMIAFHNERGVEPRDAETL